jgi:hypothetical protein
MEWNCIDNDGRSEETHVDLKRRVQRMVELLGGESDLFRKELFTEDSYGVIEKHFNDMGYSTNTRRGYLSAICRYMSLSGETDTIFHNQLIHLFSPDKKEYMMSDTEYDTMVGSLTSIIDKPGLCVVRCMSALLYYGLADVISLKVLINTHVGVCSDHYIDMDNLVWIVRTPRKGDIKVPLSLEFVSKMTNIIGKTDYIVGKKYPSVTSPSQSFKNTTGYTYVALKSILNDRRIVVQEPVIDVKESVVLSGKPKITVSYKQYMSWDDCYDNQCDEKTRQIQERHVKTLQAELTPRTDVFMWGLFASDGSYEKVNTYLDNHEMNSGKTYADETKRSYMSSLCKYLERSNISSAYYEKYFKQQSSIKTTIMATEKPAITPFEEILPRVKKIIDDDNRVAGFRVLCAMIYCNIDFTTDDSIRVNEQEIGVLRPADLKNTSFTDDGVHSYIDIQKKIWYIRDRFTKNKKARELIVPDNFIVLLSGIFKNNYPEWMLINKKGERYNKMSAISKMFRDYVKVKFDDIRASYVSYRNRTANMDDKRKLAENMGHSMKTAITDYHRIEK